MKSFVYLSKKLVLFFRKRYIFHDFLVQISGNHVHVSQLSTMAIFYLYVIVCDSWIKVEFMLHSK